MTKNRSIKLETIIHQHLLKLLTAIILLAGGTTLSAREWTSNIGTKLNAKGRYWLSTGVVLEREDNGQWLHLYYDQLSYSDQLFAINSLPYWVNDKIKLEARTVSTSSSKSQVATGRYNLYVELHSYDGYYFKGKGKITPITKTIKYSGRVVEVELSSFFGSGGVAGIEFYALKGSGPIKPYVYHSQVGVFSYSQKGTKRYFYAPQSSDFKGWVVLVRSPNTGEIIQVGSSLRHLEKYVINNVPKAAKFKVNNSAIKNALLKELKVANEVREKQMTEERTKTLGDIEIKVIKATFGVGRELEDVTEKIQSYAADPGKSVKISSSGMDIKNPSGYNRLCLSISYLLNGEQQVINVPRGDTINFYELLRKKETPDRYQESKLKVIKASFGGGKNFADVTERVKELLLQGTGSFKANPSFLKKDPTPGWKKKLIITVEMNGATITKQWNEDRTVYFTEFSL